MAEFDVLLYIGRFQILHNGHKSVIEAARERAKTVLIGIGSSEESRTRKNPFNYRERERMISGCFDTQKWRGIMPLADQPTNERWVEEVVSLTNSIVDWLKADPSKVGIIGHKKDESSFYLDLFPQWTLVESMNYSNLSSTPMRESFFRSVDECLDTYGQHIPSNVQNYLISFSKTDGYARLRTNT